tara:strand:+ start:1629 stop:2702 length:1074 start_codon:yes stop_codon:yes gene_type:complete
MRVCILGSGLSSLALAKALVNQNIYVDLFDQKKQSRPNKLRTIGISKSNIDFFNDQIVNIKKITWKLNKIEIFTDNLKKEKLLNFENYDDTLFSIIKNFQLVNILKKTLSKDMFFKKLNKKINLNLLKNYDLVVNTDASNFINKKYFYKKIIKKYNSSAYATIINHQKIKNDSAIQIFTKKGPLAFLPISDYETSIVYSTHKSSHKNENIEKLIRFYNFKYKIKKIEKIDSIELKSCNLRSYYNKNILAFGDLLHRIHPLAGQGFNMTIRDIKILIDIIKNKCELGLPLDSSVNSEFEDKLKHNNFIFSNGIDLVYEFFNFERKVKNNILSKTVQHLGKIPRVNKVFKKIADKGILF